MKTLSLITFFLISFSGYANNDIKTSNVETKKEVVEKKAKELTDVNFYIKSLKIKREKTIKC